MKNQKLYLVGSLCLVAATVIVLLAAVFTLPAISPNTLFKPTQASLGPPDLIKPTQASLAPTSPDPIIQVSHFLLDIAEDGEQINFQECIGLGSESDVIEMSTGTGLIQKIPGPPHYNDVILRHGISNDLRLWEWRKLVEIGNINQARKSEISISIIDQYAQEGAKWTLHEAWPSRITSPTMHPETGEMIVVEEVVIVCDWMEREF